MARRETLQDFQTNYSKIIELRKSRSPVSILFCTNDKPDGWLIDIVEYKSKSGEVSDNYIITKKDYNRFVDIFKRKGYEEDMNN